MGNDLDDVINLLHLVCQNPPKLVWLRQLVKLLIHSKQQDEDKHSRGRGKSSC